MTNRPSNSRDRRPSPPAEGRSAWDERCAALFEDLRRPAQAMVSRAYGRALSPEEIEDVYAGAWTATLSALRSRGERMSDAELRAYVLTAVATHASKELRRRQRRPSTVFESSHEQGIADRTAPLPEEVAIGDESGSVARDLLSSLPPRRRAVMLLRYGWGLAPREVCALVSGLSPRAYRKEITRGVEQLIERFADLESGAWCRSRQPLLRDYIAGTSDDEERRQAEHHLAHCRECSEFASRLTGRLHDAGSSLALGSAAALIGSQHLGLVGRVSNVFEGARASIGNAADRAEGAIAMAASGGGARGSGAAAAGLAAKVVAGGGGKAALACIGTGAAAAACVASGVVPGLGGGAGDGSADRPRNDVDRPARVQQHAVPAEAPVDPGLQAAVTAAEEPPQPAVPSPPEPAAPEPAPQPQPAESPEPVVTEPVDAAQEFDPVAPATAPAATPPPAPPPPDGTGGGGSASVAGDEFGP